MKVFKTILKIVKQYKGTIILYTSILILFGGINFATEDKTNSFVAVKPDILIINSDEETPLTKNLISYLEKNSNIKDVELNEEAINDALFYRDVNYIIYIPKSFSKDLLAGNNPEIEIKSTNDYPAVLAENILSKYIKLANIYQTTTTDEEKLVSKINEALENESNVNITLDLDVSSLSSACNYFNFLNYCFLAGCVYVICLVLSTFKGEHVNKRNIISSTSYKRINFELLVSTGLLAIIFWIFYIILAVILLGKTMFTMHGLLYIINSFFFMLCSLSIALLIGNIVNNKNAINGIINVVALGSSFLCGSFVPMQYLPSKVLDIAHFLPSYWYNKSNSFLVTLEEINFTSLKPFINNIAILCIFTIIFIIITNIISRYKRKIS